MKKVIGIIVIILMIPVIISIIGDIDRTPVYPTTDFNIEKLTIINSLDIENNVELFKLPNGVGDRWLSDGSVVRRVKSYTIVEDDIGGITTLSDTVVRANIKLTPISDIKDYGIYDDIGLKMMTPISSPRNKVNATITPYVHYFSDITIAGHYWHITFPADYTRDDIVNELVGITIYYELEIPIIENAPTFPEFIDFYDGGSVIVDDGIIDYTVVGNQAQINYIEGNITTVVDGQFKISKPTKIISKSNDLYDYDLSTLPNYLEYGTLPTGTYDNILEFIDNNQNKQIKLFFNDNIQESRYNTYLENDTIIINNDSEVIRIYNNDTYTSTRNLDTDITYKLEGYNILEYIDGEFDNTVLAFFWIIPVLLVGGLIYLLLKRKE